MSAYELRFTDGFSGNVIGPIPMEHAVRRVVAFCCSRRSGFIGYDLAGHVARETGRLADVGPWTILLADALAGQVSVGDVDGFAAQVERFAALLRAVPDKDLATLNDAELKVVVEFCAFGFPGVWAPKATKVGAMFRPSAIPILDGYLALAFGYARDGFSVGVAPRKQAIDRVVRALAAGIRAQAAMLKEVRRRVCEQVPAGMLVTDLRLTDIIIWTTQDDRMERASKPRDVWLQAKPGDPPSIEEIRWAQV